MARKDFNDTAASILTIGGFIGIIALWLVSALLSLTLMGTLVWAIYKLVTHFTGG